MSPLRLLLAIYARLERPLLRFNYWLVRGRRMAHWTSDTATAAASAPTPAQPGR